LIGQFADPASLPKAQDIVGSNAVPLRKSGAIAGTVICIPGFLAKLTCNSKLQQRQLLRYIADHCFSYATPQLLHAQHLASTFDCDYGVAT